MQKLAELNRFSQKYRINRRRFFVALCSDILEMIAEEELRMLLGEERGEDYVPRGLVRHDSYVEKFYKRNEGEKTTEELRDQFVPSDIRQEIENLDFFPLFGELVKKQGVSSDDILVHYLRAENGWEHNSNHTEVAKFMGWRLDFRKRDVGLEIETRQNTNVFHDVLKLEIAYRRHRPENAISCGIVMCYCGNSVRKLVGKKLHYNATIEELDRWMIELDDILCSAVQVPLWVIGLTVPSGFVES